MLWRHVAPASPPYFSTLSHKWCDSRKKVIEHKTCAFIFSTTFNRNISHSKKNLARYRQKMSKRLDVKHPLFLSDVNEILIFSTDSRKSLKYQVSSKSVKRKPSCSMRTDGHDEANSHFSQFCERAYKRKERRKKFGMNIETIHDGQYKC